MEILRPSGNGFQKIKTRRSLSSKSSGIKGVVAHIFNLDYIFCWRLYKNIGRRKALPLSPSPACCVGLRICKILELPFTDANDHCWDLDCRLQVINKFLYYIDYPYVL